VSALPLPVRPCFVCGGIAEGNTCCDDPEVGRAFGPLFTFEVFDSELVSLPACLAPRTRRCIARETGALVSETAAASLTLAALSAIAMADTVPLHFSDVVDVAAHRYHYCRIPGVLS
jgi:hypothetical protein